MSATKASRNSVGEWRAGTRRTRLEAAMTGTIKKVTDKGFGFITDTKGQEYFFHQRACKVSASPICAKASQSSSMSARGRKAHAQKTSVCSGDSRRALAAAIHLAARPGSFRTVTR
jgi:hypothetical protein